MDYTWMQTDFLSLNKAQILMFFWENCQKINL